MDAFSDVEVLLARPTSDSTGFSYISSSGSLKII